MIFHPETVEIIWSLKGFLPNCSGEARTAQMKSRGLFEWKRWLRVQAPNKSGHGVGVIFRFGKLLRGRG
ncbi:MAG: hypothetical protein AAGF60_05330 [Pseudomonadota bacterium]